MHWLQPACWHAARGIPMSRIHVCPGQCSEKPCPEPFNERWESARMIDGGGRTEHHQAGCVESRRFHFIVPRARYVLAVCRQVVVPRRHIVDGDVQFRKGIVASMRSSTAPRQYWHADTIPLASNWQRAKQDLERTSQPFCLFGFQCGFARHRTLPKHLAAARGLGGLAHCP